MMKIGQKFPRLCARSVRCKICRPTICLQSLKPLLIPMGFPLSIRQDFESGRGQFRSIARKKIVGLEFTNRSWLYYRDYLIIITDICSSLQTVFNAIIHKIVGCRPWPMPWSRYVTWLVSEKYFISHINPVLCLSYKQYCIICMLPFLVNKSIHYMPGKQQT